jgi:hypothetical protein
MALPIPNGECNPGAGTPCYGGPVPQQDRDLPFFCEDGSPPSIFKEGIPACPEWRFTSDVEDCPPGKFRSVHPCQFPPCPTVCVDLPPQTFAPPPALKQNWLWLLLLLLLLLLTD